jgi:hypothetical protein
MPIRFACPHCQQKLSIAQRKAGEQAECPRCRQSLTIPQPPASPLAKEQKDSGVFGGYASAARADVSPPKTSAPIGPPPGNEPVFLPDADDFHGVELIYDTATAEAPLEAPPAPADVVVVPRYVLYLQAGLLAVVALIAFTIGILFGSTLAPRSADGPQSCKVTGSAMHRSGPRNLPEEGAVVILLPHMQHRPEDKVPFFGLRPSVPAPDIDNNRSLIALHHLGGAYARTDASGRFEIDALRRGRYLLLVISRDQRSRAGGEAKATDIQKLRPFFDNPTQLLGDRRYRLSTESFRGDRELTIALD